MLILGPSPRHSGLIVLEWVLKAPRWLKCAVRFGDPWSRIIMVFQFPLLVVDSRLGRIGQRNMRIQRWR